MTIATGFAGEAADVLLMKAIFTELAGGEAHATTAQSTWEDYDISAIIPAGAVSALVMIYNSYGTAYTVGARKNGSALARTFVVGAGAGEEVTLLTEVDANRILELYDSSGTPGLVDFSIMGYWKYGA